MCHIDRLVANDTGCFAHSAQSYFGRDVYVHSNHCKLFIVDVRTDKQDIVQTTGDTQTAVNTTHTHTHAVVCC